MLRQRAHVNQGAGVCWGSARTRIKAPESAEAAGAHESRRQSVLWQRARANEGDEVGRASARTRIKAQEWQRAHENEGAGMSGGSACTQMNALKWVYAARAREGVCARGITLNVAQVTESKSQLSSWTGFSPEGPCALK